MRWVAALFVTCALVALPTTAHAVTRVESYVVEASIDPAGALHVRATITPDGTGGDLVQRFATSVTATGNRDYLFDVADVKATSGGADVLTGVSVEPGYRVVTMATQGTEPVVLEYSVRGAALAAGPETAVTWRLLQGLSAEVQKFEATLAVPGAFTLVDCAAGPPAHPGACGWYAGGTHDQPEPAFNDGPRGPGEVVAVTVRFPAAVVKPNEVVQERWSLDRAFSTSALPLGLASVLAVLGAFALLTVHQSGRRADAGAAPPTLIASFHPVGPGQSEFRPEGDVRPGHVGTLIDERVDPVDVTATIVDLAVRGKLLIRELPRASAYARTEWEFVRRDDSDLRPYEKTLLDAVAPVGGPVRSSTLADAVPAVLPMVQGQLYDDVMARSWFARRPDQARSSMTAAANVALVFAVVIAVLLIAVSRFGLVGLVLVALAAGFGYVGTRLPVRTQLGSSVLSGLGVLRGHLLTQPVNQAPVGRELAGLSAVLPFAIVLGGTERWIDAVVATDTDVTPDETDLSWYHGPEGWHLSDLPDSLRNFVTTVEGLLVER